METELISKPELIRGLLECAIACENCASYGLKEKNSSRLNRCIKLARDCSDICTLGARLLQRKSEVYNQYLSVCEDICRRCAEECTQYRHDYTDACAEACVQCAENCSAAFGAVCSNN